MKKIFFIMAALTAVFIGFSGCNQLHSSKTGKTYSVNTTLSVFAPAMNLDLAKGQLDKGEKYKPLVAGARVAS